MRCRAISPPGSRTSRPSGMVNLRRRPRGSKPTSTVVGWNSGGCGCPTWWWATATGRTGPRYARWSASSARRTTLGEKWLTPLPACRPRQPVPTGPRPLAGTLGHREPSALVRDVTFDEDRSHDEDRSQVRTGCAPQIMAALRNVAISVMRLAGETNIAAALRRCAVHPSRPLALIGAPPK